MNASKQRPDGGNGAASAAAAASSSSSPSSGSLSTTPPIAGLNKSTAAELAALQKAGRWLPAIELLSRHILKARKLEPHSAIAELTCMRAHCYVRLDEYNAALADCDTILSLKPRDVEANSLQFMCLLGLRRYDEAASEICILLKRDRANGTEHYKPLTKLWSRIQQERAGTFDVAAMMDEAVSLVTPNSDAEDDDSDDSDDVDDNSSDCDLSELSQQLQRPCVRLGPHADYLHPSVECAVAIAGKGRGTRVRAALSPFAGSSAASSSSSAASASASSTGSGSLPKHSLVMSMKAIAVSLYSDLLSDQFLLLRKLKDQPYLIDQVRRLHGDSSRDTERSKLLRRVGAEATWKARATTPSAASSAAINRLQLTPVLANNSFGDGLGKRWHTRGVGGTALFFLPSFFNHSCVPNCHWTLIGDQMFIRTVRDVAAGEELTISYRCSMLDSPFAERQQLLRSTWNFDCACDLCAPYAKHSQLAGHESESRSKRLALKARFYALPCSAFNERIALADSLAGLIEDHAQLVSQLGANSQLLETPMRQHWIDLSKMLRAILRFMQPSDARFTGLFKRRQAACQRRALLSDCWDCDVSGWISGHFDQLALDVQFPLHATSIAHQQSTMRQLIRQFAAHHGLPCGLHFLTEHKADLDNAKLRPLYDECLAQIQSEETADKV